MGSGEEEMGSTRDLLLLVSFLVPQSPSKGCRVGAKPEKTAPQPPALQSPTLALVSTTLVTEMPAGPEKQGCL